MGYYLRLTAEHVAYMEPEKYAVDDLASDFAAQASAALERGAKDEHGNSRVEFADGSFATFVSGKTWAHWPKG
jgi:hypothetical protein